MVGSPVGPILLNLPVKNSPQTRWWRAGDQKNALTEGREGNRRSGTHTICLSGGKAPERLSSGRTREVQHWRAGRELRPTLSLGECQIFEAVVCCASSPTATLVRIREVYYDKVIRTRPHDITMNTIPKRTPRNPTTKQTKRGRARCKNFRTEISIIPY